VRSPGQSIHDHNIAHGWFDLSALSPGFAWLLSIRAIQLTRAGLQIAETYKARGRKMLKKVDRKLKMWGQLTCPESQSCQERDSSGTKPPQKGGFVISKYHTPVDLVSQAHQ